MWPSTLSSPHSLPGDVFASHRPFSQAGHHINPGSVHRRLPKLASLNRPCNIAADSVHTTPDSLLLSENDCWTGKSDTMHKTSVVVQKRVIPFLTSRLVLDPDLPYPTKTPSNSSGEFPPRLSHRIVVVCGGQSLIPSTNLANCGLCSGFKNLDTQSRALFYPASPPTFDPKPSQQLVPLLSLILSLPRANVKLLYVNEVYSHPFVILLTWSVPRSRPSKSLTATHPRTRSSKSGRPETPWPKLL